MSHRRKGRRLVLHRLAPRDRLLIPGFMPQSKRLLARHSRARTPAAIDALLDPRRRMPRLACRKPPGKVS